MSPRRTASRRLKRPRAFYWTLGAAAIAIVAAGVLLFNCWRFPSPSTPGTPSQSPAALTPKNEDALFATYGKSPSCKSCHEEAYQLWEHSHHALAERPLNPALDAVAFEPPAVIRHGSQVSRAQIANGRFQIVTTGTNGQPQPFAPLRVLAVDPLRQFLIPMPGGRLQATELAYDPNHQEWFDVYGAEDRHAGEWGHWTGRGMNWNNMCSGCHNTRVRKNYDPRSDTYATAMAEMGIGCEACHGPMADHNAWQAAHPKQINDPTVRRISREQMFSVCGSCHARRSDLTGEFRPGDSFFDHFRLTIPDETEMFYPDGQVHEEDFEFNAFFGSRMRAAGVRCVDCHEPHSAKTKIAGNYLCYICHAAPAPPAPKIDPATHSHHPIGGRGDNCVDCHMPQTVYMQRHSRHDHGFSIPDPLLTKQLGIPNACSRCHADHDNDWSLAAVEKWYGPRMERPYRSRAQVITRARAGDAKSAGELTGLMRTETNALWRAVAAGLLKRWNAEPPPNAALLAGFSDPDPLVRAASVRSLDPLAQPANSPLLTGLHNRLDDPVRSVRIEAAWALHAIVDTNSTAGLELLASLRYNADQPAGALQLGIFALDRGDLEVATGWFQRAVNWDSNSAPVHLAYAVALSSQGKANEAVEELEVACRLAPRDAEYEYKLGLAFNEAGKPDAARAALEAAVKLDPQFARAWYNLGLACNAAGETSKALEYLIRAESLDANSPQIPYARATILARLGRTEEARVAARRALAIQPGYAEASELLRGLATGR